MADTPAVAAEGQDGLAKGRLQEGRRWPTRAEVIAAIPEECFQRDLLKSLGYLAASAALTGLIVAAAHTFLPLTWWAAPAWALYAAVCGTAATGLWVIAHECGHGAFSEHKTVNDVVGYILHSALLVPYFSWQRSHALHHANTNHMDRGHTHVPKLAGDGSLRDVLVNRLEQGQFAAVNAFVHLLIGWPAYLLFGVTSGPAYGFQSHFWPYADLSEGQVDVFPGGWKAKVLTSNVGVFVTLCLLALWAWQSGPASVLALYIGPYLVVNFWLVAITWLQHTHHKLVHYGEKDFTWVKGAFGTVDRNWGWLLDTLHHKITTTHVAHHVCERIPHYNAERATDALKEAFPDLYFRDDTPFIEALLHTAGTCALVELVPGTADTYRYQRRE